MNTQLTKDDVIKKISQKLDKERIVIGGNREFYKRKYHLKYTQKIIEKILRTFWNVVVDELQEGNSIILSGFVKIEPRYRSERIVSIPETRIIPAHYNVKFTPLSKLKQACKSLTEK